jgi:opacity protein-like surface antigen
MLAVLFVAASFASSARDKQDKVIDEQPRVKAGGVIRDANREYYKASGAPKVTTEFGLGVGARYNFQFNVTPLCENFTPTITMPVSYGAALQFRLNIGRTFGIQPEILYARNYSEITDHQDGKELKPKPVKSIIVQIPTLLSLRAAMFRFNAGPVFTLMDNANYQLPTADDNIKQMTIGRIYPTITYAAGISAKLSKRMMLDVRYADQFMDTKSENQWVWTLDQNKQPKAQSFRTRCRSVQLRYSIVF